MHNLSIKDEYHGIDHLQVANGNISSYFTFWFYFHIYMMLPIHLLNVLFVPDVTQKFISVSQLCQTKKLSIETFCCEGFAHEGDIYAWIEWR